LRGFGKIGHRKLFNLTCCSLALSKEDHTSWPAMVDTVHDALAAIQELRAHRQTFLTFSKLVHSPFFTSS